MENAPQPEEEKSPGFIEKLRNRFARYAEDDDFMSDASARYAAKPKFASHIILLFAVLFFIVAVIWAKLAVLDEVTSGEGKVIPSSQIQKIQNLEGGIVSKVLVKEGAIVEKGQVLLKIADTQFLSRYREALSKSVVLEIKVARLEAEIDNQDFKAPQNLKKEHPRKVKEALLLFKSRQNEMRRLQKSLTLAKRELDLTRPLVAKGAASEVEVLHQERTVNDLNGEILAAQSKSLDELNRARAELSSLKEAIIADKDRLKRTTVTSPVRGIVKKVNVNTIGGVVQPADDIMEIVPLDDTLLIEAKIRPADIGFLHPDQKAIVKISAYDFSIYGGLEGKVEHISSDTIQDEKDDPYYVIRVRTLKNHLGPETKPLNIIPGMHATVDILTGEKSVLDYLLKPILKARQKALRER